MAFWSQQCHRPDLRQVATSLFLGTHTGLGLLARMPKEATGLAPLGRSSDLQFFTLWRARRRGDASVGVDIRVGRQ